MNHDVAIVGGALAGATLACALGGAGIRVALVEAQAAGTHRGAGSEDLETYDSRVSSITHASKRILENIGAWRAIPPERVGVFREMHVWDATGTGAIHFEAADIGEAALGHIVENRVIQQALEGRLAELDTVKWYRPETLEDLRVDADKAVLRLGASRLQARLAVGADGTGSKVRQLVGLPRAIGDYGQRAVVATVKTELEHQETAWQRFLPSGPLAFLPLPGNRSSIVWSTTPEHAHALVDMDTTQFCEQLEQAFDSRLGAITLEGERAAFPLRSLHADRYVDDRVALIGDAAHTIHPLAGQGVNLGFLDAAALAEVVGEAQQQGRDIGRSGVLRKYERWRKGHNLATLTVMDGFKWLFGSPATPVRLARNFGLTLTDRLAPVKHTIMRHAMGLSGDLPAMARSALARNSHQAFG